MKRKQEDERMKKSHRSIKLETRSIAEGGGTRQVGSRLNFRDIKQHNEASDGVPKARDKDVIVEEESKEVSDQKGHKPLSRQATMQKAQKADTNYLAMETSSSSDASDSNSDISDSDSHSSEGAINIPSPTRNFYENTKISSKRSGSIRGPEFELMSSKGLKDRRPSVEKSLLKVVVGIEQEPQKDKVAKTYTGSSNKLKSAKSRSKHRSKIRSSLKDLSENKYDELSDEVSRSKMKSQVTSSF